MDDALIDLDWFDMDACEDTQGKFWEEFLFSQLMPERLSYSPWSYDLPPEVREFKHPFANRPRADEHGFDVTLQFPIGKSLFLGDTVAAACGYVHARTGMEIQPDLGDVTYRPYTIADKGYWGHSISVHKQYSCCAYMLFRRANSPWSLFTISIAASPSVGVTCRVAVEIEADSIPEHMLYHKEGNTSNQELIRRYLFPKLHQRLIESQVRRSRLILSKRFGVPDFIDRPRVLVTEANTFGDGSVQRLAVVAESGGKGRLFGVVWDAETGLSRVYRLPSEMHGWHPERASSQYLPSKKSDLSEAFWETYSRYKWKRGKDGFHGTNGYRDIERVLNPPECVVARKYLTEEAYANYVASNTRLGEFTWKGCWNDES